MKNDKEFWLEAEIFPKENNWRLNDEILVRLHDELMPKFKGKLISWHFFREPALRFRIQLVNKETRNAVAKELENFLDAKKQEELIHEWFFSNNGQKIDDLDKGDSGESNNYRRMWPHQKKIWEWGAEMAVESIKEIKETRRNEPTREYQLERAFHLLCNQTNPLLLNEVDLYTRCANDRLLVWASGQSRILD